MINSRVEKLKTMRRICSIGDNSYREIRRKLEKDAIREAVADEERSVREIIKEIESSVKNRKKREIIERFNK